MEKKASTTMAASPYLQTPAIVRKVFGHFPLKVHEAAQLPDTPFTKFKSSQGPVLLIDAKSTSHPSHDAECLKWQVLDCHELNR